MWPFKRKPKHKHRGPVVKVDPVWIRHNHDQGFPRAGHWTRCICRCRECGAFFEADPKPGKWTLKELRELK